MFIVGEMRVRFSSERSACEERGYVSGVHAETRRDDLGSRVWNGRRRGRQAAVQRC